MDCLRVKNGGERAIVHPGATVSLISDDQIKRFKFVLLERQRNLWGGLIGREDDTPPRSPHKLGNLGWVCRGWHSQLAYMDDEMVFAFNLVGANRQKTERAEAVFSPLAQHLRYQRDRRHEDERALRFYRLGSSQPNQCLASAASTNELTALMCLESMDNIGNRPFLVSPWFVWFLLLGNKLVWR
ncbi:MAG: hypothetical protein ABSF10_07860 [Verrucomicrobiota bacterium]